MEGLWIRIKVINKKQREMTGQFGVNCSPAWDGFLWMAQARSSIEMIKREDKSDIHKGKDEKIMLEEKALISFLEQFDDYSFQIVVNGNNYLIGKDKPLFTVKFNKIIPLKELMTSTSIALVEAYMDGTLEIEGDLYYALDHFLGQIGRFSTDQNALKKLLYSSVSKKNQEKEVKSHYDIGNEFYKLWLDDTMSYSCGYFKNPDDTLYQAQINKTSYILEKLYLKEGMSLLDIGCGWGYLLIEAAKKYKIHGTGITLSEEQHAEFTRRIQEDGLEDYLTVYLMNYRDLPQMGRKFDRIVSVGMVEHVGRKNYQIFTDCVEQLLKDGGIYLLHFISALREHPGDAWIKKYIFPGGVMWIRPTAISDLPAFREQTGNTLPIPPIGERSHSMLRCCQHWALPY